MLRRPPRSPRFPCTTLFRSDAGGNADAGFRAVHGGTGTGGSAEWRVERQRLRWDILDAFAEAAQQAGIPATEDFNGGSNEGVGYFEVNQKGGLRWNTEIGRAHV